MEYALWMLIVFQVMFLWLVNVLISDLSKKLSEQHSRLMGALDQMNWNLQNINNNVRELDYRYEDKVDAERRRYE